MRYQQLQVFVSSRMAELRAERRAIRNTLNTLRVLAWVFEDDAGAQPRSAEATYLDALENADLFIGLFWKGYGKYTVQEYEHAKRLGKDCLIYEKEAGADRERELQVFLDSIGGEVKSPETVKRFKTLGTLRQAVANDVDRWRVMRIREVSKQVTQSGKDSSQTIQYVDRPAIIAADHRAYEKIQEARRSFENQRFTQACRQYLEAMLVALDGLESEYDGILIEAKLCWLSDPRELRSLVRRIHEYLEISKLKKHLDVAKMGLASCQTAILKSQSGVIASISHGLEEVQDLISELYAKGLKYRKARTGVGIHALFEILEYVESGKASSEGLHQLVQDSEKDDTKDRLTQHAHRIRESIEELSGALNGS